MIKNLDELQQNIIEDIKNCPDRVVENVYKALKKALKQFDKDSFFKNLKDFFNAIFKTRREKCLLILNDIMDSREKLTDKEKELLRKEFLEISNIYRSLIENIIALLGAL